MIRPRITKIIAGLQYEGKSLGDHGSEATIVTITKLCIVFNSLRVIKTELTHTPRPSP
jgi:hypothetical protein